MGALMKRLGSWIWAVALVASVQGCHSEFTLDGPQGPVTVSCTISTDRGTGGATANCKSSPPVKVAVPSSPGALSSSAPDSIASAAPDTLASSQPDGGSPPPVTSDSPPPVTESSPPPVSDSSAPPVVGDSPPPAGVGSPGPKLAPGSKISALITFFGWGDNTPPQSATFAYASSVAGSGAGGGGGSGAGGGGSPIPGADVEVSPAPSAGSGSGSGGGSVTCVGSSGGITGFSGTCTDGSGDSCSGAVSTNGFAGNCSSSKLTGLCLGPAPGYTAGLMMGGACTAGGTGQGGGGGGSGSGGGGGGGSGGSGSATATGTYSDPIPFGTDASELAPGTIIWIAQLKKYFVMETDCKACDDLWTKSQQYEVALWTGMADSSNMYSEENCEAYLTKTITQGSPVPIVVSPPSSEPVDTTPLFDMQTSACYPGKMVFDNVPNSQKFHILTIASPPPGGGSNVPPPKDMVLGWFWESWKDTTMPLSGTPKAVNVVFVAFSTGVSGGTLSNTQNTNPVDASAIHSRGGKVILSYGGATGTGGFQGVDAQTFVSALQAFIKAHPNTYDGVDFDDEIDARPAQPLIALIQATRAAFPSPFIITYDAFPSGADASAGGSSWQGTDLAVAKAVAGQIDWVNVMDYNFGSWKPTNYKSCTVDQSASDDCRRDILKDFAKIYPAKKVVMGIEVPTADSGSEPVSVSDASAYAAWIKQNGYGGMFEWDINTSPNAVQQYAPAMAGGL